MTTIKKHVESFLYTTALTESYFLHEVTSLNQFNLGRVADIDPLCVIKRLCPHFN